MLSTGHSLWLFVRVCPAPAVRAERGGHCREPGLGTRALCPAAEQSSGMGGGDTQLLRMWGRRRESYWKLEAAKGLNGEKVWMRPALTTRPGKCLLSGLGVASGWEAAAVHRCRVRRA